MSNFERSIHRAQWRSDHPAQFDLRQKNSAAEARAVKLAKRRSFRLWFIEKLNPKLYAELVERALGKAVAAGAAEKNAAGDVLVSDETSLDRVTLDMETVAARLDSVHGVRS